MMTINTMQKEKTDIIVSIENSEDTVNDEIIIIILQDFTYYSPCVRTVFITWNMGLMISSLGLTGMIKIRFCIATKIR
jgi:hypothetical protein